MAGTAINGGPTRHSPFVGRVGRWVAIKTEEAEAEEAEAEEGERSNAPTQLLSLFALIASCRDCRGLRGQRERERAANEIGEGAGDREGEGGGG